MDRSTLSIGDACVIARQLRRTVRTRKLGLRSFSRTALSQLGREFLLNGHLQDRVGLPLVAKQFGGDAYVQFSIEEWMGASPIYSKRMQRAMGFEGSDVETVFKNMQLEIGAPHQFMDFQFRLDRPDYGEFWLSHCGALLDVEPYGEERVKLMCHDIEDPTFDATAAATNPSMKMRPIHRPPRVPTGRFPHCRWSVFIGDEAEPFEQHPNLELVRASKIAKVRIKAPKADAEKGGWSRLFGQVRSWFSARRFFSFSTRHRLPRVRGAEPPARTGLHALCVPAQRR